MLLKCRSSLRANQFNWLEADTRHLDHAALLTLMEVRDTREASVTPHTPIVYPCYGRQPDTAVGQPL